MTPSATAGSSFKAAARLFENSPTQVSLADIAEQAEVSTATAYRHFPFVEETLHAFRSQVGSEPREFSARQTTTGMARAEAVSRYWVSLVPRRSPSPCGRCSDDGDAPHAGSATETWSRT